LPEGATLKTANISAERASAELPPAGKLDLGEGQQLRGESSTDNAHKAVTAEKLNLGEGQQLRGESSTDNVAPKPSQLELNARRELDPQPVIRNANSLIQLAREKGFEPEYRLQQPGSLNSSPVIAGAQKTLVGKRTSKRIRENIEKQKKIERQIKKANEAAKKGPSFLDKVLSSFGFNALGKSPEELQRMVDSMEEQSKTLSQKIANNQEKLTVKRANAHQKNIKATKQMVAKAQERARYYGEVLGFDPRMAEGVDPTRMEANIGKNGNKGNKTKGNKTKGNKTKKNVAGAIEEGYIKGANQIRTAIGKRAEREIRAETPSNITKRINNNSLRLGENLGRMFNNSAVMKTAAPTNT